MAADRRLDVREETMQESADEFVSYLKTLDSDCSIERLSELADLLGSDIFTEMFEDYQNFPNCIPQELNRISKLPNLYGDLKFELDHLKFKQRLIDKENLDGKSNPGTEEILKNIRQIIIKIPNENEVCVKNKPVSKVTNLATSIAMAVAFYAALGLTIEHEHAKFQFPLKKSVISKVLNP